MNTLTLEQLNTLPLSEAVRLLDGLYEHSPWIVEKALQQRPFVSLAAFKHGMVQVVAAAGREPQLALLRAHPELAGKAMVDNSLTTESTNEQSKAGLTHCTPAEFDKIQRLNAEYNARFGFPFILAVRGPRGTGLSKAEIIATLERRVQGHPDFELAECLRNVHRIAEIRLNDKFGYTPTEGHQVWDWQEALAQHTDAAYVGTGQLTVTYLTDAHLACARQIQADMLAAGCDSASIDAVGNVVGRYESDSYPRTSEMRQSPVSSKPLLTGSHYDTVRNGGKYDGRLGIYVPLACVQALKARGQRLPYALEVVAFAEEEGQRYKATFLGSGALTGDFDPTWLDQTDADGISMRDAMAKAGLDVNAIGAIRRNPADYQGFVEVHIEQGPVLNALDIPLGVVTSINASVRYLGEITGMASHAGTTPMGQRRDAAAAVAELILLVEHCATQDGDSVGTVGQLQVPMAHHVVPGAAPSRWICVLVGRAARCTGGQGTHWPAPDLRATRPAPQPHPHHAGQRGAQRARMAAALGSCSRRLGCALAPHAQRRRARCHEAAHHTAASHAVCTRPEFRHQPQPAGIHHQRRHATRSRCVQPSAAPTGPRGLNV
uniref:Oxo-4-hydroxy-4-carboxy-5-ureidoimidazoline decarboxylase domain-containing protein n=1 Tax=Curvibacter symbiont subsp. Hydra magnipapillata TaxID=667019 RepID=C9YHD4_CURXX|nr:hypothetical protein Csp_B21840 [Curvibacter putative symbiont of Hydra magnipapillata]